jgi:sortase A
MRPQRPPGAPPPPRRPPIQYQPLSRTQTLVRTLTALVAIAAFVFIVNAFLLSHLQHAISQQLAYGELRQQLADGVAPVSEGDVDDNLLPDGAPLAILTIPKIGVDEVIVEGSDGATLMKGPGHRRDSVLPGQQGVSVVLGRMAAYGGPFSRLQELVPGDRISVVTGQGRQQFRVIDVRNAGDPVPPAVKTGESRLVLETARGPAFVPSGIAYVDAELTSKVQERGARQTSYGSLPPSAFPMATDTSTVWALVFALQFLVVVEVAAVLAIPRSGPRKAWIVFVPLVVLGSVLTATQLMLLLPNLL